jgi:tetratricopeptide (TPR) repeat protein
MQSMEALYGDRLLEHVDRLAHHAQRGEIWDKALLYLRQSGARAAARCAHREAVAHFGQALEAVAHLPDGREMIEETIDLRLSLANSLVPIGELGPIPGHLREAQTLAQAIDDQPSLGRVASFLSQYSWFKGEHARAVETGHLALTIGDRLGDLGLQVRTNLFLGQAYHARGDYEAAIAVLRTNLERLQGGASGRCFGMAGLPSVMSSAWWAWCLAERGQFSEAIPRAEEAVRIAKAVDHPFSLIAAYFGAGNVYLLKGELPDALSTLEPAFELCRIWDNQLKLWFAGVAPSLGAAYVRSGRTAEALPLLEQAAEQAASMGMMYAQSLRLAWLAEAFLRAGRADKAEELVPRALELSREHGERGHEAWIHWLEGEMAADAALLDRERAEAAYSHTITLAHDLGLRPLAGHCHLSLGILERRTGRHEAARDHLTVAATMFGEMGMRFGLQTAEAALRT